MVADEIGVRFKHPFFDESMNLVGLLKKHVEANRLRTRLGWSWKKQQGKKSSQDHSVSSKYSQLLSMPVKRGWIAY
jgi:ppGpp synthetase/RelA/SpoT-type nucleotidyltranferase